MLFLITTIDVTATNSELQEYNSEHFNTAGRTIKTGLIAVDIVSHWTWWVHLTAPGHLSLQMTCLFKLAMSLWVTGCCVRHAAAGHRAATLLQSCNVAYKYGISGPFWCALHCRHIASPVIRNSFTVQSGPAHVAWTVCAL